MRGVIAVVLIQQTQHTNSSLDRKRAGIDGGWGKKTLYFPFCFLVDKSFGGIVALAKGARHL